MSTGMFIFGSLMQPMRQRFDSIEAHSKRALARTALELERIIVGHMQDQDLPWKDLNEQYLAWKISHGLSENILIATGTAMQTVQAVQADRAGHAWFVGWPRTIERPDGGNIVLIMWVHEFGSTDGRIPARPIVQPSLREVRPKFERIMRAELKKAFVS